MYYRQPRYYDDFRCVGSECIEPCCYGWRIKWLKDEVDKVKNAPGISPELKELVENSFVPIRGEDGLKIRYGENGDCPFHGEDGLCKIQKELGAEYLSYTCTAYPRIAIRADEVIYRGCNSSCFEILKRLLNDERAMDLLNVQVKDEEVGTQIHVKDGADDPKGQSELVFRGRLLEFWYELISDKKLPLETAIILGALAAQKLTELVASERFELIPEALKSFRKQFHNPAALKSIEDIKPNYHLKFAFLSEILEKIIENSAAALLRDQTGTLNIDLYNIGEANLKKTLEGREFFLRNLALNLLFELDVPFEFKKNTISENYALYVTAFAMLKLNMIAVCSTDLGITMRTMGQSFVYKGDDKILGMTAIICRGVCQSRDKAKDVITILNSNKFTTPAYLALLVK